MAVLTLRLICLALLAVGESRTIPCPRQDIRRPAATSSGLVTATNGTTILSANIDAPAIVTLDYGHAVEGIPTFEVLSVEGDTSVLEITYAESLAALSTYMVRQLEARVVAKRLLTSCFSRAMGLFR